jgi:LytS/YehU family sensor histidine kinase
VIESIRAEKRSEEISYRQTESELRILKSQVQPHFLFNSLNNIYYDTYKVLPGVANRISMLADIMRYLMEESQKETVPVETEIKVLKNYIGLEKERIKNANIHIDLNVQTSKNIPPMLLMPLVENLFKHGIFNADNPRHASIILKADDQMLEFTVENTYTPSKQSGRTGTGLENLRRRLILYYENNFELLISNKDGIYCAVLKFPLAHGS